MSRRRRCAIFFFIRLCSRPPSLFFHLFPWPHHIDDPFLSSLGGINIKVENHVVEQNAGKLVSKSSSLFVSFVRRKETDVAHFFFRVERVKKKLKKMALAKTAAATAVAALLVFFAASLSFVSSSEAPDPVSFRADDGVTQISSPEEFTEAISRSRKAACVYFYLPRCPACAQTKTVLLTAANKLEVCLIGCDGAAIAGEMRHSV